MYSNDIQCTMRYNTIYSHHSHMHIDGDVGSSELSSGRATTTLYTCVNIWLLKRHRPLLAASSRHGSTTATHCCTALLLQSSRSCRELKTTSPGSSVSSADVSTPDRY